MKAFSINNYVKVKLNPSGVEIMNQKKDVINFPEHVAVVRNTKIAVDKINN